MDDNFQAMYAQFTNVWNAKIPGLSILTYVPEIRYQGLIYPEPDRTKYFCRLSTVTIRAEQATLAVSVGDPGRRRFKVRGLIFAQIFGPRQDPGAYDIAGKLAKVGQSAFRAYPEDQNIWFTNATVENLDPDDNWVRWNVSASFTFDEFQ